VRLQAPGGVSAVNGLSGTDYLVGPDRLVIVRTEDAAALLTAGFERIADENA
jgi:hypothetical protein